MASLQSSGGVVGKGAMIPKEPTLEEMRQIGLPYPGFVDGLKALMGRSGGSQHEFAEKLGVSQPYLSKVFSGKQIAPWEKVIDVCQSLGMTFSQVVAAGQGNALKSSAVNVHQLRPNAQTAQEMFPDQVYLPYITAGMDAHVLTGTSPIQLNRDWVIDRGVAGDLAVYRADDDLGGGFARQGEYLIIDLGAVNRRFLEGRWYLLFFPGGSFLEAAQRISNKFICLENDLDDLGASSGIYSVVGRVMGLFRVLD